MPKKNRFRFNLITLRANGMPGGYTRAQLAEVLDCHPRSIQAWEAGDQEPRLSTLIRIAECFGVTLDQLVYGERLR